MTKFQDMVEKQTKQFIEAEGFLTCAFSTSPEKLDEKLQFLESSNSELQKLKARWWIYPCDVCKSHRDSRGIHCEIVSDTKETGHAATESDA
jgi:hypothetical protein